MTDPQALLTSPATPEEARRALSMQFFSIGASGRATFVPSGLGRWLMDRWPAATDRGGKLYVYHGNRWQEDGEAFYRRKIREVMDDQWRPPQPEAVMTWVMDGAGSLNDAPDRDCIRVLNGVLKVCNDGIELDPPSVSPYTPVYLPVHYDPAATCPMFDEFMRTTLPADLRDLVQEIAGYLLTPDNSQQKAFMFQGEGGNGKSTWINIITALLGDDNTQAFSLQQLAPDFRFNVANLYGKLANLAADISADELSSSSVLRSITGGDRLNAEHKGKTPFKFKPFVRMVFSANRFPAIANPTNALFDRWIVVPFAGRFRGTEKEVKDLDRKVIEQELPGVLNWALAGLARLRERGSFTRSGASEESLKEFRIAADTIAQFLADCDDMPAAGTRIKCKELFVIYQEWIIENNHRSPLSQRQFYDRVRAIWGMDTKHSGYMSWVVR